VLVARVVVIVAVVGVHLGAAGGGNPDHGRTNSNSGNGENGGNGSSLLHQRIS
jgi:hypothetical protein